MNKPVSTCNNYHDSIIYEGKNCPLCEAYKYIGEIQENHFKDLLKNYKIIEEISEKKKPDVGDISEIIKYNGFN